MKSKYKRIAAVSVALTLAAAPIAIIAGCTPGVTTNYSQQLLTPNLDSEGRLYWRNKVDLYCNIGYETSTDTAISFSSQNTLTARTEDEVTLPDGNTYRQGDLKPTWKALGDKLRVNLIDRYVPAKSDASIEDLISDPSDERLYVDENGNLVSDEKHCVWDFDIITGSCAAIQTMQNTSADARFLDLSLYLDYMPNYKAFLEENPIIYMSLTTDTDTGAMYYAPYFDGNDDIEKYVLAQKSWAVQLLDKVDFTEEHVTSTFAEQAEAKNGSQGSISTKSGQTGDNVIIDGTHSYITSFMGQEGSWQIDVIDPADSRLSRTVKLTVDYDNAKKCATTAGEPLYEDIVEAAGKPYGGNSGNIVDLQNFVINETGGAVKGEQLLKMVCDYIDVAYLDRNGGSFYGREGLNRSDVFCGATAAWDVDLLAAMSRCVVTCADILSDAGSISSQQWLSDVYAFGGRSSFTQRIADMYAFAGELYGVRGLESRYEFTYIDDKGEVKDARADKNAWDAMNRLSAFAKEGLLYTGDATGTDRSVYTTNVSNLGPVYFMEHDYVQTQTLYELRLDPEIPVGTYDIPQDYEFSPIITPVSRWNDGANKIMRFTESWRSVKNTGFCIPYQGVSNSPERLSAVLAFIDFLFSKDGQILMTYGPRSTTGNSSPDGWWYATEVAEADLSDTRKFHKIADETNYLDAQYESMDGSCFVYEGKVYEGLEYSGRSIPIMTDDNLNCFKGKSFGGGNTIGAYTLNYTNYARKVIGSALPIGNKDQGFEYQCTAECGLKGASVVDAAINRAGIIKHVYQQVDNPENNMWYVIMPTLLPLSGEAAESLTSDSQKAINSLFTNSSSAPRNSFVRVMYNGYSNGTFDGAEAMPADGDKICEKLVSLGINDRTSYVNEAWQRLYGYYENSIKHKI